MSKTGRVNHRRGSRGTSKEERRITVSSVRRDPPDLRKLSRAVIAIAMQDSSRVTDKDNAGASATPRSSKEEAHHDK